MRISGTEPSSVILLPNEVVWNLKSSAPKVPNQGKAEREGVINLQNIISVNLSQKILMLSNATNQPKSTVELGYKTKIGKGSSQQ